MAGALSTNGIGGTDIFAALGLGRQASPAAMSDIGAAGNQFMTLLITQIRNQDPLNPMQNAEFTSQLAQINTVQGIEKLNASLAALVANFEAGQTMQAAAMIGKHVLVAGNTMEVGASGGLAGFELVGSAEAVRVVVRDGNGLVMKTLDLGAAEAGPSSFYWDGRTEAGEAVVAGTYSFAVEATRGVDSVGVSPLQVGTVNAVVRGNDGFKLDLGRLGDVSMDDVRQIL